VELSYPVAQAEAQGDCFFVDGLRTLRLKSTVLQLLTCVEGSLREKLPLLSEATELSRDCLPSRNGDVSAASLESRINSAGGEVPGAFTTSTN
jgi:hypothetical protein